MDFQLHLLLASCKLVQKEKKLMKRSVQANLARQEPG